MSESRKYVVIGFAICLMMFLVISCTAYYGLQIQFQHFRYHAETGEVLHRFDGAVQSFSQAQLAAAARRETGDRQYDLIFQEHMDCTAKNLDEIVQLFVPDNRQFAKRMIKYCHEFAQLQNDCSRLEERAVENEKRLITLRAQSSEMFDEIRNQWKLKVSVDPKEFEGVRYFRKSDVAFSESINMLGEIVFVQDRNGSDILSEKDRAKKEYRLSEFREQDIKIQEHLEKIVREIQTPELRKRFEDFRTIREEILKNTMATVQELHQWDAIAEEIHNVVKMIDETSQEIRKNLYDRQSSIDEVFHVLQARLVSILIISSVVAVIACCFISFVVARKIDPVSQNAASDPYGTTFSSSNSSSPDLKVVADKLQEVVDLLRRR